MGNNHGNGKSISSMVSQQPPWQFGDFPRQGAEHIPKVHYEGPRSGLYLLPVTTWQLDFQGVGRLILTADPLVKNTWKITIKSPYPQQLHKDPGRSG